MKKITVIYDTKKCVGAGKCIELFPSYFSWNEGKAGLRNALLHEEISALTVSCSLREMDSFIMAAESCPVNAIKVIDEDEHRVLVDTQVIGEVESNMLIAQYDDLKEFVMDQNGYFLIRILPEKKEIEVGLCREVNKVAVRVIGKKPLEIYQTIIKHNLITRFDHAAYLGRELQKAYIALQKGIVYVQDDELIF